MIAAWANRTRFTTYLGFAPMNVASTFDIGRDCLNDFTIPWESETSSDTDTGMFKKLFFHNMCMVCMARGSLSLCDPICGCIFWFWFHVFFELFSFFFYPVGGSKIAKIFYGGV